MSTSLRTPRGRRGAPATAVALIGLLGCAFGAIEAIWAAAYGRPWLVGVNTVPHYLHRTHLRSSTVLIVAVVVGVVGLLLVVAAIVPSRRPLLEVADEQPAMALGLSRESLRRRVVAAAEHVDGVSSVDVRAGRRRMRVRARTPLQHTDGLTERIEAAVRARLDDMPLRKPHTVRVRLEQTER